MPRVERTTSIDSDPGRAALRNRSMSMEEADLPKGIYSTSPTRFAPSQLASSPAKSGNPLSSSP